MCLDRAGRRVPACQLPGYGPDVFEHCDLDDDYDYENDYAAEHHFKACLTKEQIDHLWSTGHCHAANTTRLPFVAPDGLLFSLLSLLPRTSGTGPETGSSKLSLSFRTVSGHGR